MKEKKQKNKADICCKDRGKEIHCNSGLFILPGVRSGFQSNFNLVLTFSYCRSAAVKLMLSCSALELCCIMVCNISEILVNRIFSMYLHGKPLALAQGILKGGSFF